MRFAVLLSVVACACACGGSDAQPPRSEVAAASAQPQPLPTVAPSASASSAPSASPFGQLATSDAGLAEPEPEATGAGGGGTGEGTIGLGNIGRLGHGAGSGSGYGTGHGSLGGAHSQLRQGATAVNGRLPPEVIQRIVRQSFGKMKLCYQLGLRKKADLSGRVYTKFVIDRNGDVSSAQSTNQSTMPDMEVVSCVVSAFKSVHFPQPEGGIVTVVYPLIFSPGDQ